jgi:hypothetical protein
VGALPLPKTAEKRKGKKSSECEKEGGCVSLGQLQNASGASCYSHAMLKDLTLTGGHRKRKGKRKQKLKGSEETG